MKSQLKRFSKSTMAVILSLCMLVSCMTVGIIATDAAYDEGDASLGYNYENGNWLLKGDIDSWGNGISMTNNSSNSNQAYKDIYLFGSASDSNFTFKFKENDGTGKDSWFGPDSGSDTACGTSGTKGGEGKGGNYYINRKDLGTTATTVYKVRIWFEHAGWVGAWYSKDATYSALAPTLSVPSTGTAETPITLTGSYTSANKVGNVTETYQYSTDDGSTWTDLGSGSYTASSTGTVKFRYKVVDDGVVSGTNSTANRVEYSAVQECTFSAAIPNITGINGDWGTGDVMTLDSGNNYYYEFNGGVAKYFRFKVGSTYYEAYDNNFDLVSDGTYAPYDGSTDNKKYTTRSGNGYAFKLTTSSGYKYRVYFDVSAKKTWYTREIITATYTGITAVAKGTTDGTNYSESLATLQSSTSVVSTTGLAVNATAQSGYTFVGWTASGSGTFTNAGNASTTFYPTANNEVATAQYKKNYTFTNGTTDTNGTVTVPAETKVAGDSYSATVTPADGYKIKTLYVGGSAVADAVGKTSAYTYSGTAQGSTTPISVVATFEVNTSMNLYIAGRFRVRPSSGSSSWTTTYSGNDDWNATSTSIPFTYLSDTTYKVETYASLAELSEQIGSSTYTGDPVFFVYDTTNNKNWYASSAETMSKAGVVLTSSGGANGNLKFSSSSIDTPVTIYYDTNTHKIWYSVPVFYDVTVTAAQHGIVTASPARTTEGATVALTVTPDAHYTASVSAVKDGTSNLLQLTPTATGYTFLMPDGDVTVTPSFSPTYYNNISYSSKGSYSANAKTDDATYTVDLTAPAASGSNNPGTGTYVNGVSISAPNQSGYTFYKWVATNGTFTQGSAVTESSTANTTFYPTANGATLKALYRMNYSITVNNPSNGTISSSTASCHAGDDYVITLTPSDGYKLGSLTVNNVEIDIETSTDITISTTGYTYNSVAGGSANAINVVAQFVLIPDTEIYVNKHLWEQDDLWNAYIWSTIQGEEHSLGDYDYPGEQNIGTNANWVDDPDYPDYRKRTFKLNSFGTFQIIFSKGASGTTKTLDSDDYLIGGRYFIDTATANSAAVLHTGYPTYTVVGVSGLVGTNWNTGDTNNDMTYKDTVSGHKRFSLTKTGSVSKSTSQDGYGYKVVTSHGSTYQYGQYPAAGTNQYIHVLYDNSTVEFIYTPATSSLTATVSGGNFVADVPTSVTNASSIYINDSSTVGTAKSVTLTATKSYTEANYSSGYTTKDVYVKVVLDPHYEITGWEDSDGNDITDMQVGSNTVTRPSDSSTWGTVGDTVNAHFQVKEDVTITPTIAKKTHTVTFNANPTGGTVAVNREGEQTALASGDSVNEWENYEITATPATGYMFSTFTITGSDGTTDVLNGKTDAQKKVAISYKPRQMKYSDETVTVTFEKIGYTLTSSIAPPHGTVTFYPADGNGDIDESRTISTATYQQIFYAKYTPMDDYKLKYFSIVGGNDAQRLSDNAYESSHNIGKFQMGSSNATINAYVMLQYEITYYVDMHNTDMTNQTVSVAVTDSTYSNILTDASGAYCTHALTKVSSYNDTDVYSFTINTPFVEENSTYDPIYFTVTYSGDVDENNDPIPHPLSINSARAAVLKDSKEVWIEAENESSQNLSYTTATRNPTVDGAHRRIYLAKPASMVSDGKWSTIGLYYWDGDNTNNGWNTADKMTYIGADANYYYYYADIPKYFDANNKDDKINNLIFQGWGNFNSHSDSGFYVKAQTSNITNIPDDANYFVLSSSSSSYSATQGDNVIVPGCTKYKSAAKMNVDVYREQGEGAVVSIALVNNADQINYTAAKVTYQSSAPSIVSVDATTGQITPHKSGEAEITIRVFGTIGERLNTHSSSVYEDCVTLTSTINVSDPSKLDGFEIMSLESANYTVNVPKVNNDQPGYFDMTGVVMTVTGIKGVNSSVTSAIITPSATNTITVNNTTYPCSFTVKYAKPMSSNGFTGYDDITVTGTVKTISISETQSHERYGLDHWEKFAGSTKADPDPNYTKSKTIGNGVETAVTTGIVFGKVSGDNNFYDTFNAVFAKYEYVDVTFVYDYYLYNPKVEESGMINYPYDPTYAGTEDRNDPGFNTGDYANTHTQKTYTVSSFEVRNVTASTIAANGALVTAATNALGVGPDNNYYDYQITTSTLDIDSTDSTAHTATVNVHMTHSVKTYSVYLNGVLNTDGEAAGGKYYYQEYADLSVNSDSKWYAVDGTPTEAASASTDNAPLLATGKNYKFRVKGNTSLKTVAGEYTGDFNRSEVDFSHYEIEHRGDTPQTLKEYLLQNFYIADFFSPDQVLDESRPKEGGGYLPYDDAQFVGGGVVYYSVDEQGNPRSSNATGLGYVNGDTESADYGKIDAGNVKAMLKSEIIKSVNSTNYSGCGVTDYDTLANAIGTNDALQVAYGTEIEAHQYKEGGMNSGILFRYLPFEEFSKDSTNWDSTTGAPLKDDNENYFTSINSNTFRYSNSLQSYQYVYASGNENKETNNGRNMRLYSYYVYSYVTYNKDTNVPETKYEIVLSDNYSDASTYWDGTN